MDSNRLGNWLPFFTVKYFRFLLPQSLRARLILLVLATVLAGQAATLYSVSLFQRDYAQTVALDLVATTIRTLQSSMEIVAPQDRMAFVHHASRGQWRLWSKPLPNEARLQRRPPVKQADSARPRPNKDKPPKASAELTGMANGPLMLPFPRPAQERSIMAPPEKDAAADSLAAEAANTANTPSRQEISAEDIRRTLGDFILRLNNRLDGDSRVAISRGPKPELYISLTRPDDITPPRAREWLVIPLDRIDPPLSTPMLAWWSGGLALVLLIALWFSWHITRPITSLVQATDQLAAGKPARVEPAGPTETRRLGESFNAMLDALSASESTRRTLLAGLPHDLKAPLARMWLRIEMSEDQTLKQGMRTDLQDMQHMVDQFINFLRGTDPATYQFSPFALNEWVNERVGNWRGAGEAVILISSPDYIEVNADSVALSRLLDNLVSNALHHGKPPVHVKLYQEGNRAILQVTDHGQGIVPSLRDDALKPFVRLDAARTRTGNVGLGLALAEAIARAHGGSLELGEGPEGGLSVKVILPVYRPE